MNKISTTSSYKWWVLFTVQCALLLLGIDLSIVNIALPTITKDLQIDIGLTQWIISVYLVSIAISVPILGRVSDIVGRKKVFIGGLALITIASFFCAISSSLEYLIVMRALQGMGSAACLGNCIAIISTIFPFNRQGLAQGIGTTIYTGGVSIGVLGGGYLTDFFGWRSIFFLNTAIALFFILISSIVLLEKKISVRLKEKQKFDYLGSALFILMIIGIMLGMINYLNSVGSPLISYFMILTGFVLLITFIITQLRSHSPLVDLKIYKIKAFAIGNAMSFLFPMLTYSIIFMIPFYVQNGLHLSASTSGIILLPYTFTLLIMGTLGGHLRDKFGARIIIFLGFLITAFSLVFLILLNETGQQEVSRGTFVKLIAGLFFYGIGAGLMSSPIKSVTFQDIPHSQKGVFVGLLFTINFLGQAFSAAFSSAMVHRESLLFTPASLAALYAKTNVFYIQLIIAFIGAGLCYFLPRKQIKLDIKHK